MTVNIGGTIKHLVIGAAHRPFGGITNWAYGNGLARRENGSKFTYRFRKRATALAIAPTCG